MWLIGDANWIESFGRLHHRRNGCSRFCAVPHLYVHANAKELLQLALVVKAGPTLASKSVQLDGNRERGRNFATSAELVDARRLFVINQKDEELNKRGLLFLSFVHRLFRLQLHVEFLDVFRFAIDGRRTAVARRRGRARLLSARRDRLDRRRERLSLRKRLTRVGRSVVGMQSSQRGIDTFTYKTDFSERTERCEVLT